MKSSQNQRILRKTNKNNPNFEKTNKNLSKTNEITSKPKKTLGFWRFWDVFCSKTKKTFGLTRKSKRFGSLIPKAKEN